MNPEEKLAVLSKIAEKLNSQHITWAVGASLLLYLKGKVNHFHDIDIMVAEEDASSLQQVLLSIGELKPAKPNLGYKTKVFQEFVVDGVDVDVMGGLIIVHDGKDCYFPLRKEDIKDFVMIHSQKIPLQSMEQWKILYNLMGRLERVKQIESSESV